MNKLVLIVVVGLMWISLVQAATLTGTIYNEQLLPEPNVILEVDTQPIQKFLAKEGKYSFVLPPGNYILTAEKGEIVVSEPIVVVGEGVFVFDLFLLPDLIEETELLNETREDLLVDIDDPSRIWAYVVAGIITIFLVWRIVKARKRYGPLPSIWRWPKRKGDALLVRKEEPTVTKNVDIEQVTGDSSVEEALAILRKNEGRMTQKDLRKELMHLSEAKVSLIVTELEHLGKVEKIKKGRGNVLILKK